MDLPRYGTISNITRVFVELTKKYMHLQIVYCRVGTMKIKNVIHTWTTLPTLYHPIYFMVRIKKSRNFQILPTRLQVTFIEISYIENVFSVKLKKVNFEVNPSNAINKNDTRNSITHNFNIS